MEDSTINYYNKNAKEFVEKTVQVDFRKTQEKFLYLLPKGAKILDFGCGSGRDTKYFLSRGYQVDAVDGSEEICALASAFTGIKVRHMFFNNLKEEKAYDGIWACSSILHLPKVDLVDVFFRIRDALKSRGILYASFKYGDFEGIRNGRYFTDFTRETLKNFMDNIPGLNIEESWISSDVRPERANEKWLNVLLRKE